MLRSNRARIAVLTLIHFTVDFCAGLITPLPEPTLVNHLGVDLATIMGIITGCALLCNLIQPLAGSFMPRTGYPALLVAAPVLAGLATCIEFTHNPLSFALVLCVSFTAIGLLHPEAAMAVQSLTHRSKGLAVACFMSGGFVGYSTGPLVSAAWAQHRGLAGLWILVIPAALVSLLALAAGLHRLQSAAEEPVTTPAHGSLPFALVFPIAIALSVSTCMLVRLYPIFIYRSFGPEAQSWGGAVLFAYGIAGAFMSYAWGYLADRFGTGRIIIVAELLALPFFMLLLFVPRLGLAPLWAVGIGMTAGSIFPLSVVLARNASSLKPRLRMGLSIGGAWAIGELAVLLASLYIGRFEPGDVTPARTMLLIPPLAACVVIGFATLIARRQLSMAAGGGEPLDPRVPERIP